MANKTKKKDKKGNIFSRNFKKLGKFFKDLFKELKKVTWPTKKEVVQNTGSVLLFCLLVGGLVWIADFLLKTFVGLIYS